MPFVTTRRVEFGDTDMAGIVHFSRFFGYMEAAETDFLLARGLNVTWEDDGVRYGFPRVAASCDYARPVRFGDTLAVTVTVERVGSKSVSYRHEFTRAGESVASGKIIAVYSRKSATGGIEPLDIPPAMRAALES